MDLNELKKLINEEIQRTRQRNILKEETTGQTTEPGRKKSRVPYNIPPGEKTETGVNPSMAFGKETDPTAIDRLGQIRGKSVARQQSDLPPELQGDDDESFESFGDPMFSREHIQDFLKTTAERDPRRIAAVLRVRAEKETNPEKKANMLQGAKEAELSIKRSETPKQSGNPDLDRILADPKAVAYIKQKLGLDIPQQYIPKDTGDKTVK